MIRYRARETKLPDLEQLRMAVSLGLVLIRFPNTRGGTELGANTRNDDGSLNAANTVWNDEAGTLTVCGRLRLDYTPVRLDATFDLKTFKGRGKLTVISDFTIKRDY